MAAEDIAGKVLAIFFPITAFVALGFDHVVANMFFLPAAHWAGVPGIGWGDIVGNWFFAALGNVVGGGVFVGAAYWFLYLKGAGHEDGDPRRHVRRRRHRGCTPPLRSQRTTRVTPVAGGDELPDHRVAGDLPDHQQPPRGLGVGEQDQLLLAEPVRDQVRTDPVEVAAAAAGDEPVGQRAPGPVDVGDGRGVDHGGDPAGAGHLVQVPEQAETGDVGGAARPGGERGPGGVGVEGRHHRDRLLEHLAGRLVPVVEDPQPEGFGQGQGQPGRGGVAPQQPSRGRRDR